MHGVGRGCGAERAALLDAVSKEPCCPCWLHVRQGGGFTVQDLDCVSFGFS